MEESFRPGREAGALQYQKGSKASLAAQVGAKVTLTDRYSWGLSELPSLRGHTLQTLALPDFR